MYKIECQDLQFLPHCGCDVSIPVKSSGVLCLTGENGIGKTTLLRRFSEGQGMDFSYVAQMPLDHLYDRKLSVLKEIALKHAQGLSRDLFLSLWHNFQLETKKNRFQSELSGGESQAVKLCLGAAAVRQGLILDEPSQFLDEQNKQVLGKFVQDVSECVPVVMIEHDLNWVKKGEAVELRLSHGMLKEGRRWTIS